MGRQQQVLSVHSQAPASVTGRRAATGFAADRVFEGEDVYTSFAGNFGSLGL